MKQKKINAPINILDFEQYIFFDFGSGFSIYNPKHVQLSETSFKSLKYINFYFKNDILYFKDYKPRCPHCGSYDVVKYGFTNRKLIFKNTKETLSKVQRYKCKCGKTFQTDLSDIVSKNSNFTNEIKETALHLISEYYGSLHSITNTLLKEFGISVSHQSIENWLIKEKTEYKLDLSRYSGYYVFDVEWLKINGKWKYRHSLLDSITNQIISDKIYDKEDENTVKEFLSKSTYNKSIKSITTDLDKKYGGIINQLGFKHQHCLFHTIKNLNKTLRTYFKENKTSEEEKEISWKQLKTIKQIFKYENYEDAEKELQSLFFRKNEFTTPIYQILENLILPKYKNYIYQIKDEKIESTSNKIENAFQKTMPKHKKRTIKTIKGMTVRINLRNKKWNQKRLSEYKKKQKEKNQQSF